jgi:hypothetical protein
VLAPHGSILAAVIFALGGVAGESAAASCTADASVG